MAETSSAQSVPYSNSYGKNARVVDTLESHRSLDTHPSDRACCQTHRRQIEKATQCAKYMMWVIIIAAIITMGISGGLVFDGVLSFGSWCIGKLTLDTAIEMGLAILSIECIFGIILLALDYGVYRYRIHGASCPHELTIKQTIVSTSKNNVTSAMDILNEPPILDKTSRLEKETSPHNSEEKHQQESYKLKQQIAEFKRQSDEHKKLSDDLDQKVRQVTEEAKKVKDELVTLQTTNDQNTKTIGQLQQTTEALKKNDRKQDKMLHELRENGYRLNNRLDNIQRVSDQTDQNIAALQKRMENFEQRLSNTNTVVVVAIQQSSNHTPSDHKVIV